MARGQRWPPTVERGNKGLRMCIRAWPSYRSRCNIFAVNENKIYVGVVGGRVPVESDTHFLGSRFLSTGAQLLNKPHTVWTRNGYTRPGISLKPVLTALCRYSKQQTYKARLEQHASWLSRCLRNQYTFRNRHKHTLANCLHRACGIMFQMILQHKHLQRCQKQACLVFGIAYIVQGIAYGSPDILWFPTFPTQHIGGAGVKCNRLCLNTFR